MMIFEKGLVGFKWPSLEQLDRMKVEMLSLLTNLGGGPAGSVRCYRREVM